MNKPLSLYGVKLKDALLVALKTPAPAKKAKASAKKIRVKSKSNKG